MFRFAHISYFWLLAALPVFWILFTFYLRWRKQRMKRLADSNLLRTIMPDVSTRKPLVHITLWSIAIVLLITAAAGPQFGSKLEEAKREGVELMVCLDVSNSMLAEDLSPNRLERAKRAVEKLIKRLRSDKIGMIVFAGQAYVQLPITTDYGAAKLFIGNVNTNTVNVQGTAIGSAIDLAMESFDMESQTSKAIIIISDGENHEDDALKAAKKANELGIIVHTIGMGSEDGAPIPLYRGKQQIGFKRDKEGNTVVTKLNESMLADVANAGGGQFIRATNADAGLNYVFDEIEKMETTEFGTKVYTDYEDRFQYPLALALIFLLLDILIGNNQSNWIRSWGIFQVKERS
jgi:Ca-activated chloride channel family protein